MKIRLVLTFTLFFSSLFMLSAQHNHDHITPCATPEGKVDWLVQYQQNPTSARSNGDTLWIPLTIHLVGENDGTGYFDEALVYQQVCALNVDFGPSNLQFYIKGDFNYIPNSVYNNHSFNEGFDMMVENNVESTLNSYICDSPAGACGYSAYGLAIALNESCIQVGDHTFAHEVGHFLSLPHIFSGWEGTDYEEDEPTPFFLNNGSEVELVDGSNCATAGDGFCDTPIDYLSYRWGCQPNNFSNQVQVDPTGVEFESDGTYFMSYALDNCMSQFSPLQMDAMYQNVLDEKEDYLNQDVILGPVFANTVTPVYPSEGEFVAEVSTITVEWEPVTNATMYEVEFSPITSFSVIVYSEVVSEPMVTYPQALQNATVYWRVRPFNEFTVCEEWSAKYSFETGDLTNTNTVEAVRDLAVRPVPAVAGQALQVDLSLPQAAETTLMLTDLYGRTMQQERYNWAAGQQQATLSTANLNAGVYLLQIQANGQSTTQKVVISQ